MPSPSSTLGGINCCGQMASGVPDACGTCTCTCCDVSASRQPCRLTERGHIATRNILRPTLAPLPYCCCFPLLQLPAPGRHDVAWQQQRRGYSAHCSAAAPVCCRVPTLGRRAAAWRTAAAMRTAAAATAAAAPLAMTAATTQVRAAALLVIATGCRLPAFVCWLLLLMLLLLLLLLVMIFACGLLVSRGRISAYTAHQMGRASVSASS